MDIDIELNKVALQQIIHFCYNVGDYLFHEITYLFKYSMCFKMRQRNNMFHLLECLTFGTLKALECHRWEFKFEILLDSHHGQANDEKTYIYKMSIFALGWEIVGWFHCHLLYI